MLERHGRSVRIGPVPARPFLEARAAAEERAAAVLAGAAGVMPRRASGARPHAGVVGRDLRVTVGAVGRVSGCMLADVDLPFHARTLADGAPGPSGVLRQAQ